MPAGDRAPALRQEALRLLSDLDAAEAAACVPGAARTRSIVLRRNRLRRLAALARHHGVELPPAVAARVDPPAKGPTMTSATFPSLFEDLNESPLHDEFRRLLKAQIERGESPVEVIEAALATATALCIDSEGLLKTSARLTHVGNLLATASPEVQAKMATEQQRAGATAH